MLRFKGRRRNEVRAYGLKHQKEKRSMAVIMHRIWVAAALSSAGPRTS